jgi:hypothetical protein
MTSHVSILLYSTLLAQKLAIRHLVRFLEDVPVPLGQGGSSGELDAVNPLRYGDGFYERT